MNHIVTTKARGALWVTVCTCGWESLANSDTHKVEAQGRQHQTIIRDGNTKAREASQQYRAEQIAARNPTWESLSRADQHITRCNLCGTWQWDNDCTTCTKLHQRHQQKAAA